MSHLILVLCRESGVKTQKKIDEEFMCASLKNCREIRHSKWIIIGISNHILMNLSYVQQYIHCIKRHYAMNTTCLPKGIMSIHVRIMYLDLFYEVIQKDKIRM